MSKTYRLQVAGLTRDLPICPLNEKLDIAAFVMFSDVELTVACAEELLKNAEILTLFLLPSQRVYLSVTKWQDSRGKHMLWQENQSSFT